MCKFETISFLFFLLIIFISFRRQLDKMIEFCLEMADSKTTNDDKQLIELKLVNILHAIALRSFVFERKNFSKITFSHFRLSAKSRENRIGSQSVRYLRNQTAQTIESIEYIEHIQTGDIRSNEIQRMLRPSGRISQLSNNF